jgi:radical SAM/Cys-rich protein
MNHFADRLVAEGLTLRHGKTETLQINVGKLCNLTCMHCHVNAGPKRTEIMTRETIDRVIDWLAQTKIAIVDLTGGSPEMIPDFRYLVDRVRALPATRKIIDRCNLTILRERGYEWLPEFLAAKKIEIIASMPCYSPKNVNLQRGEDVFERSIAALRLLNRLGYGVAGGLQLHLVYNPLGPSLPAPQAQLETDFKRELAANFGIVFNKLYTLTNLPVGRFGAYLKLNHKLDDYMDLLIGSFNPKTVGGLMCRSTISIGWRGEVYDCDFNQQLGMQWKNGHPTFLWDVDPDKIDNREVMTANHCFGCAAGAGSSCGGALV